VPDADAVVVGSGFGGLAAAVRLQAAGLDTTLLEKRDKPGGRAYVYEQDGFTFDAGPTVITAPHTLREVFEAADQRLDDHVDLHRVDPFYRLDWPDGTTFDYVGDLDRTLDQIRELSPEDVDGYRDFLDHAREVFEAGYEELADQPFLKFRDMIRAGPQLIRLRAYRSVYDTVARYVDDPHLRQAFSFHSLLIGGNPFTASGIYTLIHYLEREWGVWFPEGGTGALVQALADCFQQAGGTLRLRAPVDRITTEEATVTGVELEDGERLRAPRVVSNADVVHTYDRLLRDEPRARKEADRLAGMRHSPSLFLLYLGTERTYPDLEHHTVLFSSRYESLLDDIWEEGTLPQDPALYLHAPTRTDPSLAPEGCETLYALAPVPNLRRGDVDWSTAEPRYADRLIDLLEDRCLPGLRENLVTRRTFTPEDFQATLNAFQGTAFSLEPTLRQSAYFRARNRAPRVDGLYLVGAGTHPGAGIPGVVNSAKATARLVLEDAPEVTA
jgi:phytoene desaturase